ncbi:hypothetical protein BDA99DRAFT_507236 [Phascolomyces articulosus]|uniref:EF-hand domain-containing protein n=1 Tax=Phascolomyces articulosus TaxID=60185 RepID=A0AAD5KBJ1_9FUNG|nr:hypothetical protein BDA99DRAFT_507236 [Phascolomyces articulosus]
MLTREQKKEIKKVFEQTDTVGAGLLDGEGLYKASRALGLEVPVSEDDIDTLLRSVNRHEEGYIDLDDFNNIVSELMMKKNQNEQETNDDDNGDDDFRDDYEEDEEEDEMMDDGQRDVSYQALASKGNGMITLESLLQACQKQGETWTIKELKEMLNEADTNHDGVVDPVEFQRIWKLAGL